MEEARLNQTTSRRYIWNHTGDTRGHDHMVVGCTTTCAISTHHH